MSEGYFDRECDKPLMPQTEGVAIKKKTKKQKRKKVLWDFDHLEIARLGFVQSTRIWNITSHSRQESLRRGYFPRLD
uniref:Uncharacterized protein n=1 Tax=Utricularia reniformis TaxID=192314 RepID=A0A1Y0B1Z1_9LAMI|nr:hypothetical protein AEK19_MT1253 [Utricularia reniformis]ART31462.1 hypothetical protein AEK19_MT1253 [Utricularia reniformis]